MSENCCGDVAIEALVTVCRAMSQLEMGSLAVASFGKKGNIKLLHDVDQSFTAEAGVQMISNLTFKQENNITDEPVVELLKYLNDTLDNAVTKQKHVFHLDTANKFPHFLTLGSYFPVGHWFS